MVVDVRVSLVVPVRDEADSVDTLIHSINQQVRLPDQVVIVDGGSTDGTPALLRQLTAGDVRYRVVEAGPATPGKGRNVGIDAAIHPWIALTDAGIELDACWLDRLVRVVEHDEEVDVVLGTFEAGDDSWFMRNADLAYVSPMSCSPVGPIRSRFIASCVLRKETWSRAGGFPDLRAAEDLLFMRRLDEMGCRMAYAPEARVTWELQRTVLGTFQRFRRYSMHNVLAGQERHWHHGLARQYLAGLGLIALAGAMRRSPLPLLAAAGSARVARTVWRRREGRGIVWALRPDRLVTVAAIMAVVDAATFVGWAEGYLQRKRLRR